MNKGLLPLILTVLAALPAAGQDRLAPQWLRHAPESCSAGTVFVPVTVPYVNRQGAGQLALGKLSETLENDFVVSKNQVLDDTAVITRDKGGITGSQRSQTATVSITVDGSPVQLRCVLADEWWNPRQREYSALYQVAKNDAAAFCSTSTTTRYGFGPVALSLIPGAGQFAKGDILKGSIFMGGCAAGTAGIIFLESQKKSYAAMRAQTHDVNLIKRYAAKESNLGTARNVCIGITCALFIYNLIDAAAAPGARKVKVSPDGVRVSF